MWIIGILLMVGLAVMTIVYLLEDRKEEKEK